LKVTELLQQRKDPFFSFEILPPVKGKSIQSVYDILDPLMEFKPPFINVTYHRAEYTYVPLPGGYFRKVITRKRPGTVSICASIMNRYKVEAVPHLTCGGFSVEETEDALIDLHYIGVTNVLALRGDASKNEKYFIPEPGGHKHASDLVRQMKNMNHGIYLEESLQNAYKTDFCIGVAGYPEKHFEAADMQTDLNYLKYKVECGADFIVTQMFFDNEKFYAFVKQCRKIGISVPIIPGLKPITRRQQIETLPRTFHITLPEALLKALQACASDAEVERVGIEWSIHQCKDLIRHGYHCLHYYTMGQVRVITEIARGVL
jgi:methylenetetrahydrofolate reductase (NADPH)